MTKTGSGALNVKNTANDNYVGFNVMTGTMTLFNNATGSASAADAANVYGGTLQLLANNAFNSIDGTWHGATLAMYGGTFDLNGKNDWVASLNIYGGTLASTAGGGTLRVDNTIAARLAAPTSVSVPFVLANGTGTNGLTLTLGGTLDLQAANTFTGATSIYSGLLNLDFTTAASPAANVLAPASTLALYGGALGISGSAGANSAQTLGSPTFAGGGAINIVPGAAAAPA